MVTGVDVKSKVFSGLKWNALSVFASKTTDFVVKLILARLVLPDAYGVVGMAMLVVNFLAVISDMGLFNALVQKKEEEFREELYSSAFWLLLGLATLFIVSFFLFLSPLCAKFYNEPRLVPVLNALSFYLFFSILNIIPRVILTRKLDFKNLVRITYFGSTLSSVIAIGLAFLGFGVWSLVAKYLIGSSIVFLSYWFRVGWRPKFIFKGRLLAKLAGYSTYIQINSILFYFRNNLDYIIIGKLVSAHLLGVYTLAFTLSENLRSQLYAIFNKVFFPVYSKLQNDKAQIKYYYLKVMGVTATVTFPVSILFIGLASNIISIFFGAKWMEAVEPLRILSVASMIFAISGTPAEVLKSIGKPGVSFYLNFVNTFLIALPLIYFGQKYYGLAGVSIAVCMQFAISRLTFHHYMKKYIYVTNREVFSVLRKPVIAAAVMLIVLYAITLIRVSIMIQFLLGSFLGILAYSLFFINDLKKVLKFLAKGKFSNFLPSFSFRFKRPSYIYHFSKKTVKVFGPYGVSNKYLELKGNRNALQTGFWAGKVMQVKPAPFSLHMTKGKPLSQFQFEKAGEFMASKLDEALTYSYEPANKLFDFDQLRTLEKYGLHKGLVDFSEEVLKSVLLPLTSAHGDLHTGNMIWIGNEIKIIDWSMFTEKGTFIFDLIHFYNCDTTVKPRESWIIPILKDQYYLDTLARRLGTTANHLRLGYCINRISGEMMQKKHFHQISKKQVTKYNYVLNHILNGFKEASVQHCDSIIQ